MKKDLSKHSQISMIVVDDLVREDYLPKKIDTFLILDLYMMRNKIYTRQLLKKLTGQYISSKMNKEPINAKCALIGSKSLQSEIRIYWRIFLTS